MLVFRKILRTYLMDDPIMKMEEKRKTRLHRNDLNRPRSRHGNKYNKYEKCLIMTRLICIKQHLSNI